MLMKSTLTWKIIIRPGHNSAHATTAELLWHVQMCDPIGMLESCMPQRVYERISNFVSNKVELGGLPTKYGVMAPSLVITAAHSINNNYIYQTEWESLFDAAWH